MKRELEILAPAGDIEIFKSVIDAGADAVYFGGQMYSARASAANLSFEEAEDAIAYAHVRGKKAYITTNTLLKNKELGRDFYDNIRHFYEMGTDAFLVQDMGVFSFIKEYFPDAVIHMSTQCNISSEYGVRYFLEKGASRIVLARELSLDEIRRIYEETHAEIEAFVHGALCVCYSGQCLMSSMIGSRSGNRGKCAQPCRLGYEVFDEKGKVGSPGEYVLSPRDLCGVSRISEMFDAGVMSFKIEGRLKSKSYATGVVSVYRKYADRLLEGRDTKVSKEDMEFLAGVGSRSGFTDLYLDKKNGKNLITYGSPALTYSGEEYETEKSRVLLKGEFYAREGENIRLSASIGEISVESVGETCQKAEKRGTTTMDIAKQLGKTGESDFAWKKLDIDASEGIFIPTGALNGLRRECLSAIRHELIKRDIREALPYKKHSVAASNKPDNAHEVFALCNDVEMAHFLAGEDVISVLGLSHVLLYEDKGDGIISTVKGLGKRIMIMLPPVVRGDTADSFEKVGEKYFADRQLLFMASSYDGLEFLKEKGIMPEQIVLSPRLYTMNDLATGFFKEEGFAYDMVPWELNRGELSHRDNSKGLLYIYGRMPLMYMANCTHSNLKGCDKRPELLSLHDRKDASFPLYNDCSICMNTLYNSLPTSLLSDMDEIGYLGMAGYVIDLCHEKTDMAKKVLAVYRRSKTGGEASLDFKTTRGHYKRGV